MIISASRIAISGAVLALCAASIPASAQVITEQDRPNARPLDGDEIRLPAQRTDPVPQNTVPSKSVLPSIIAVLAHPDDEITIAPILARAARDGADVKLVFATSGNAGPGVSGMEPGDELANLREEEARCSAFALGLPEPTFWKLDDGKLSAKPRGSDSPSRQALAKTTELLTQNRPTVVMTWGPDGGYGHGDHRMISAVVTQSVQSMDNGRPDLLYAAIPSGSRPNLPEFEAWATTAPDLVTDRLAYEIRDLEAARAAINCYSSQFSEDAREALPGLLHSQVWRGAVHFRLAFATPR